MFNKFETHNHSHSPKYPQHIHEHKAPTEESIRLYREIEKEVVKNIVARGRTTNPMFECNWTAWDDPRSRKTRIYGELSFSGGKYELEDQFDEFDFRKSKENIGQFVHKLILGEISRHLTIELFNQNSEVFNKYL